VTQRRLADEQLRQTLADLEKAYRIQREFVNSVTHEIRTPMTAVKGYAEMLLEGIAGPLNEGQATLLGKVLAGADSSVELVTSLLEVARLKSGRAVLHPKACKPGEVARKAVSAVIPQAHQKRLAIDLRTIGRDRMGVYDEQKLIVILNNLLSNAVKFTAKGRISVSIRSDRSGVEIIVADTGMGIRRKDLGTIFEQFQQLDHPTRHKPAGFGLGLSIVAAMVQVLGATLVVSSRRGLGTAFTLQVPNIHAPEPG
jgi:signal transduction histidine kinase